MTTRKRRRGARRGRLTSAKDRPLPGRERVGERVGVEVTPAKNLPLLEGRGGERVGEEATRTLPGRIVLARDGHLVVEAEVELDQSLDWEPSTEV